MIFINKENKTKNPIFFIENLNEDKYVKIHEILTRDLKCEVVSETIPHILVDYARDGIIFRHVEDDMIGSYFTSHKRKKESKEYYEKLERVLTELVAKLNMLR